MKIKFLPFCFLTIAFAFYACKKDAVPVLKGDIKGIVSIFDGYGYSLQDRSKVKVQLSSDKLFLEDSTDTNGQYSFKDIPFGNYRINLIRENYIESILDFRLSHVGGEAPTITSQTMYEIPEYKYAIDSLTYNGSSRLLFYLKAIDATKSFSQGAYFYVHFFFSQSPDVSSENYDNSFVTFSFKGAGNNIFNGDWWWWDVSYNFLKTYSGPIYCRVYPQVPYHEMWPEYDLGPWSVVKESLGKPSEVLSFTLDKITRNF